MPTNASKRRGRPPMKQAEFQATKSKIIAMRDQQGMSMVEIAVALGFKSAEAVYRYLRKKKA